MDVGSDVHGFVNHSGVLRAVALLLRNAATERRGAHLFVGQLGLRSFLIVAPSGSDSYITAGRLDQRLNEAVSFFHPRRDWKWATRPNGTEVPRMKFDIQLITVSSLTQTN